MFNVMNEGSKGNQMSGSFVYNLSRMLYLMKFYGT
ncbi:hypothetical protein PEPS_10880 [Persicobacter psychrovividus]|uniref:Uncharacterized protein n=1 Tax=Persicobacter psychrovividus TaxID=387638 RepID=A0ABM7VCY5_9BACT|nr:hypothetical protein PEPS_10880 [Persicobacter psychrovividus]